MVCNWEYFNNQGNNNQGNKEETESTKNSAIPLVLPYSQLYLADVFDDPLQSKKERGKAERIRFSSSKKEEEEEKEQQAAMLQKNGY